MGGILTLDDTIEDQTHTKENEIICWHYSLAKRRHVKGVNLLSSLVINFSIPMIKNC
ncbi:MAG: hypothetical protein WCT85_00355 [Parachlamydiales bacterium]